MSRQECLLHQPGGLARLPYEPLVVHARVAPYTVKGDLSNVANVKQFGEFTPEQRRLLARNGFFVAPQYALTASGGLWADSQLYFVYERNDYLVIPSFISADTVLQLYHIFYDYSLRMVEHEKLIPLCAQLTEHMLRQSVALWRETKGGPVKTAALKNVAYFGVAMRLLGKAPQTPGEAASMVQTELSNIDAHEGRRASAIFPYSLDFSQFVPRGHYTRSEELKRYFKTMMWYGLVALPLRLPEDMGSGPAYEQVRQALLITKLLYETTIDGKPALETWARIYEPTSFYVETSDDLTPSEWRDAAAKVYGKLPDAADLDDQARLDAFIAEAEKLRPPRVAPEFLIGIPTEAQFRFMGQRFVPDSYMLQNMVWKKVGTDEDQRRMPKGLDVMAALGSERAYEILDQVYKETHYASYDSQMSKLRDEFGRKDEVEWRKNLYWGWLWSLKSLLEPPGEGYPSFMRNAAWVDKCLSSVLASWAELRHDTILYAKQSVTAECGGEEAGEQPPIPKGYVEPAAELYHRLLWLTRATRQGLAERELLSESFSKAFSDMEDMLVFLERISIKELTREPLTAAEYDEIRLFGSELEILTNTVTAPLEEEGLISEADERMALIADVHSDLWAEECLEEGVGDAGHIFVVVPIEGKLFLTRGAAFSYYEFTHPIADRLTDEKWQEMLRSEEAPKPPVWTAGFLTGPKSDVPEPKLPRVGAPGTGC